MISLKQAAQLWVKEAGCCPMNARVVNWGCQGCARWVVIVEFAGFGDTTEFYTERDTRKQAEASARAVNGHLTRWANAAKAA